MEQVDASAGRIHRHIDGTRTACVEFEGDAAQIAATQCVLK